MFVIEVKKTNRRAFSYIPSFRPTMFSLPLSLFLSSLSSYSHHPCSLSRWLPHSRLPLRPLQLLPTIRRAITFRSTSYPTSRSTAMLFCFPSENFHRLSAWKSFRVRKFRRGISETFSLRGNDFRRCVKRKALHHLVRYIVTPVRYLCNCKYIAKFLLMFFARRQRHYVHRHEYVITLLFASDENDGRKNSVPA